MRHLPIEQRCAPPQAPGSPAHPRSPRPLCCLNRCVYQREDEKGVVGVELNRNLVKVAGKALEKNLTRMGPLVLPVSEQLRFAANFVQRKARAPCLLTAYPGCSPLVPHCIVFFLGVLRRFNALQFQAALPAILGRGYIALLLAWGCMQYSGCPACMFQ